MNIRLAALPVAITALALLSGCAPSLPGIPTSVDDIVEQVTGGSVDVGSNVAVPAGWPNLPLPQGELVAAVAIEQTYSLTYTVSGVAAADALLAQLSGAGFTSEAEADYGELKSYVLTDGVLSVTLSILRSDEGVTLTYSSTPKG